MKQLSSPVVPLSNGLSIVSKPNNIDEMLRGYYLERKLIFEYEEKRLITTKYAKKLRQNVNNLENYSLKEAANTLPYDMVELVRRN